MLGASWGEPECVSEDLLALIWYKQACMKK